MLYTSMVLNPDAILLRVSVCQTIQEPRKWEAHLLLTERKVVVEKLYSVILIICFQFFNTLSQRLPVPRILGACGRVVVTEDFGKSLLHYMDDSWEMRAELALQILELIDSFVVSATAE